MSQLNGSKSIYPKDKLYPDNSTTAYRRKAYDASNYCGASVHPTKGPHFPSSGIQSLYPQDCLGASVNEFTQSLPPQREFFSPRMRMSGSLSDLERACPPPPSQYAPTLPIENDNRSTDSGIECVERPRSASKSMSSQAVMCFKRETGDEDDERWVALKEPVTLQYVLETFTETRTTSWAHEPYVGQPIDGSTCGSAPGPWDIVIQPPQTFEDFTQDVPIPHTDIVRSCHECASIGRVRCWRCHGRGRLICQHCDGSGRETYFEDGHHHHRSCTWCHGTGRNRCNHCIGHGQVACKICDGRATLKCYVKLVITWTNHVSDHNVERNALPTRIMKNANGGTVYEEQLPRVWPINHFPDESINKASTDFIRQHASAFPSERILMQRHHVRVVPKSQSKNSHKKQKNVYAMGFEQGILGDEVGCFRALVARRCNIL